MKNKNKKFFFATSKIKEYWSKEHPIIFSGDWCFDYKDDLIKSRANIIPYQWNNSKKVINAQIYCDKIFEEVLKKISKDLNKRLKLNHQSKYYRILIGNWLIHYIHQCYDKYTCIMKAKKANEIFTFYINEEEDNIPYDFEEFIDLSLKPEYQTRLFSELFAEMNLERRKIPRIIRKKTDIRKSKNLFFNAIRKLISYVKNNFFYFIFILFSNFYTPTIIVSNPYFKQRSLKNKIYLFIRSKGRMFFFNPIIKKICTFRYYL